MKNKTNLVTTVILVAIFLIGALVYGIHNRHINEIIDNEGVYGIGTVINEGIVGGNHSYTLIQFEFYHEGRRYVGISQDNELFGLAVEMRQYVVRYVPDKLTDKTTTNYARIYLDVPIPQDYIIDQIINSLAKRDSTIVE